MQLRFIFVLLPLLATSAAADTVFPISTSAELEAKLLNTGANSVPDGGVIELAAGTYTTPSGGGFLIFNPDRDFTIRAATPGTVILNGSGSERIFRFIVNNAALGGAVVFEGLTFRNGRSTQPAFGSAITLQGADATFIDCLFDANVNQSTGSGSGTVGVQTDSSAFFLRSTWQDNTSLTSGTGAVIVADSKFWCHECEFLRNRNNVPGHNATATGAALVATSQSAVLISNSRFEDNEAGFAGGAIDVKGFFTETPVQLVVTNSTFVDNIAMPDPGVVTGSPAAGGVANIEDNAVAQFYNSRLLDNSAQFGGAISAYRATVEVYDSVLRGNFATGRASTNSTPRGGAIFAISNDTAGDGTTNHPPSQVLIRNSLFDGTLSSARRGGQIAAAYTGGCVYTTGDITRHLGLSGVPQGGTQAQNSATLDIAGTAFVNCDVEDLIAVGPHGGGVATELAVVTIDDSLFADGDAIGTFGAGGAIAMTRYTDATLTDTIFTNNSAAVRGGAIFTLGAEIDVNGCSFFENTGPGATVEASRGAAIHTGPQEGASLGITGIVRNSLFANNNGLAIYEDDRMDGTGLDNTVTYENNDFFGNAFPPYVYRDTLEGGVGSGIVSPAGLNAMVVDRGSGNTTDKAPLNNNTALASQPVAGKLLAVPPQIIDQVAAGDPETSTESFLAHTWYGACAELDGQNLTSSTGLTTADTGVHSLMVFDNAGCSGAPDLDLTDSIDQAATPSATLSADPIMISSGGSSTLEWATPSGTFIESAMDQGQGILGTASGSVSVSPSLTTNYTYFAITEEGGAVAQQKVYVDEEPDLQEIFSDGFESGNFSAWSSSVP